MSETQGTRPEMLGKQSPEETKVEQKSGPSSGQDGGQAPDLGQKSAALLIFLLCAVSALEGADQAMLPSVSYALQLDLDLPLTDITKMNLVQALAQSGSAPIWGVLSDRQIIRRKDLLVLGCILQGVITVILAGVDELEFMILLRALNGAMLASLRPVAAGIIADVTPEAGRGKVYGWLQLALNLGLCSGGLIGVPFSTKNILGLQGWRVAFIGIGSISISVGVMVMLAMTEPPHQHAGCKGANKTKGGGVLKQEVLRLKSYFQMPTFCFLVIQGCFGCIPWNALAYATLFFQVRGLGDEQAASLAALGAVSAALGSLMGGVIGDKAAEKSKLHGRAFIAQISVVAGIPIAYLFFMTSPPESATYVWYFFLVMSLGLTATWCATGVNWPIISEIVDPQGRASIMAWLTALEGSVAAVGGNAAVGVLAQNVFGYNLRAVDPSKPREIDLEATHALGRALMLTSFVPWIICLSFYTMLHWSYPRDLLHIEMQKIKDLPTAPAKDPQCCDCSQERPRLSLAAAQAETLAS